jgi:hypothetical protein
MTFRNGATPSPAMVVGVVALSLAVAGSAVAGTDGLNREITKSKVKKISKKQAKKQIEALAPGLSVANAENAANAANAATATQLAGLEYVSESEEISSNGVVALGFAGCPEGTFPVGGGVAGGNLDVLSAGPAETPSSIFDDDFDVGTDGWGARAQSLGPNADFTTIAICARAAQASGP